MYVPILPQRAYQNHARFEDFNIEQYQKYLKRLSISVKIVRDSLGEPVWRLICVLEGVKKYDINFENGSWLTAFSAIHKNIMAACAIFLQFFLRSETTCYLYHIAQ